MKKFLMVIAVAFVTVSASAQFYVGGGVGIGSSKVEHQDAVTTYKFVPEVGYNIDDNWAVGVAFGWQGEEGGAHAVSVEPYARYTFLKTKYVNGFVDGGVGYGHVNGGTDLFSVGLKPGVAINFNDHFSFVTHIGFFGYEQEKTKDYPKESGWGADLDGNNIVFGLYYNF